MTRLIGLYLLFGLFGLFGSGFAGDVEFELAARSARSPETAFDWYAGAAIESSVFDARYYREREEGTLCWGCDLDARAQWGRLEISGGRAIKTAQKINSAAVAASIKHKGFGIGVVRSYQDWDPAWLGRISGHWEAGPLSLKGEYATDLDRETSRIEESWKIPLREKINVTQFIRYQKVSTKPAVWRTGFALGLTL